MTLRLRLMLIIGLSFTLLWCAASVWMFLDLRNNFRAALDERLAASAHMVAALVAQLPDNPEPAATAPQSVLDLVAKDGVACEVRLMHGGLVARTQNSPGELGMATQGYSTRMMRGELWRSYTLEQGGKRVTTADRVDKRKALLFNILLAMAVPFVIAMLGSLIVLWLGIRRGLAPLETIRQSLALRNPEATDPLPVAELPAEITPLVQTINQLLARTQSAIERERRFTGDAAHELRTPLTAVKTHLQVARLTSGEQNATSLAHAETGVQRLQHTLEQLLTLARVEGPFTFDSGEMATAEEMASLAIAEIPADLKRRIVHDSRAEGLYVAASPTLVATALRNLLDNALRYSPPDSPVTLRISASADSVCFSVMDKGGGLNDAERHRAAQRFWRKGIGQGSGLGLSIVEAIAKRFSGDFLLLKRDDVGLTAQLVLPRLHPHHSKLSNLESAPKS